MAKAADIFAFRSHFPGLASTSDPDVATMFNTADVYLDPAMWSATDFPLARLYWVAHMLTLLAQQGNSGQLSGGGSGGGSADQFLTSVRIGERTVNFGQRQFTRSGGSGTGPGEDMLTYTLYGQLFLQLRTRNIIPIAVV